MIERLQRARLTERILRDFYRRGVVPTRAQVLEALAGATRRTAFGQPLFAPRGASPEFVVDPDRIVANFQEARFDLDVLFEDLGDLADESVLTGASFDGQAAQLVQRLGALSQDLAAGLARAGAGAPTLFFDSFGDTSKVDLSRTTAAIDPRLGQATPPISGAVSRRVSPAGMQLVSEAYPPGGGPTGAGSFLDAFTDYADRVWSAQLPPAGSYAAVVSLTGGPVEPGHAFEMELNRVEVEPTGPLTLLVEWSNDGRNWFPLCQGAIDGPFQWTFPPQWALLLRFTVGGTHVGLRRVELGQTRWAPAATLVSRPFAAEAPLHAVELTLDLDLPPGTALRAYYATESPDGPWTPAVPGLVQIAGVRLQTEVFTALAADSLADPATLWAWPLPGPTPLPDAGALWRGVGQFEATAFWFDWKQAGDALHRPEAADWGRGLGLLQHAYVTPQPGGADGGDVPPGCLAESPLLTWSNATQDFWGVAVASATGAVLQPGWNYRFRTFLYSDRAVLVEGAGGGVYALGARADTLSTGWALRVNGVEVASDHTVYAAAATPASGTLALGREFSLPLVAGWNAVELLLYQPGPADAPLPAGVVVALFRPNLLTFRPVAPGAAYAYAPPAPEYPIWADGAPLERVSEFALRWGTPPRARGRWAWRLDPGAGTPTAALLNADPRPAPGQTLDRRSRGSEPLFRLQYPCTDAPAHTLYFRADFLSAPGSALPPRLRGYRFLAAPL